MASFFQLILIAFTIFSIPAYAATEFGQFDGGSGSTLRYVLGTPSNISSDKLFIYLEGDGSICHPFESKKVANLAATAAVKDYWIVPETTKQRLCNTDAYRHLDFNHRVTEVQNLVTHLRADARFKEVKFYLMGSSAGVDLAAQATRVISDIEGIVLISGSSSNLEVMFYNKILLDGQRSGLSQEQIQDQIRKQKTELDKIKSNCTTEEALWGDRSNLFWCQLLTGQIESNLLAFPTNKKILIVHGAKDPIVPIEEAFMMYSKLVASSHNVSLKIFPEMTHNFFAVLPELLEHVEWWSEQ